MPLSGLGFVALIGFSALVLILIGMGLGSSRARSRRNESGDSAHAFRLPPNAVVIDGPPILVANSVSQVIRTVTDSPLPPDFVERFGVGVIDAKGLAAMRQHDPAFDASTFSQRAMETLSAVWRAQTSGHFDMVRHLMSARYFDRWQAWATRLPRSESGSASLELALTIAQIRSESSYDRVAVRTISPGSSEPTFWIFIRSAEGRNHHRTNTPIAVCTNCGAPVESTGPACRFCGAAVVLLGAEWVLDDAMPESSWRRLAA